MTGITEIRITCDHGIVGGSLDHVARFEWSPEPAGVGGISFDGHWVLPLQFTGARLDVMEGDRLAGQSDEVSRTHYEIPCQVPGCSRRAYRSDEAKLQTLLTLLVQTRPLQDMMINDFPGVRFSSDHAVVTLAALHAARDTLAAYGQRV